MPLRHKARKRFGQNFLHDQQVIDRIIASIAPQPADLLVEIGPGQAALTRPLLDSGAELHLIELDRDLVARLEEKFAGHSNITIHSCDALKANLPELTGHRPFRLIGNLPYNISTPLIFHVLQWSDLVVVMHFMLQKEVVDRMAAAPGSRTYGRLSVMTQFRADVTPLFDVLPESFSPVPRVCSSIVRLQPLKEPPADAGSFENLKKVVTAAFSMRRKTLRNSLRSVLSEEQINEAGIDPGQRAEQLSLSQFAALARSLPNDAN
ncbi:MAG: 16S rRNA (adenine(1518)-N(6)/adenine(1519)-N(6))-dimethyltransferase RsmA [Xanthomonadales bacterium]|nr:16S rRNA (adenine(1518)-N(6)/adenine(1519)-N(6))-dimethyltransferase RsmA [Xanthomonadales bacterium]